MSNLMVFFLIVLGVAVVAVAVVAINLSAPAPTPTPPPTPPPPATLIFTTDIDITAPPALYFDPPLAANLILTSVGGTVVIPSGATSTAATAFAADTTYTAVSGDNFSLHHAAGNFATIAGGNYTMSAAAGGGHFRAMAKLTLITLAVTFGTRTTDVNMSNMFKDDVALVRVVAPPGFGKYATTMAGMFSGCTALFNFTLIPTSLALGMSAKADFTAAADPSEYIFFPEGFGAVVVFTPEMFKDCVSMRIVTFPASFNFGISDVTDMFANTPLLTDIYFNSQNNQPAMNLPASGLSTSVLLHSPIGSNFSLSPWSQYIAYGYTLVTALFLTTSPTIVTRPVLYFSSPLENDLVFYNGTTGSVPLTIVQGSLNTLDVTFEQNSRYFSSGLDNFSLSLAAGDFTSFENGSYTMGGSLGGQFLNLDKLTKLILPLTFGTRVTDSNMFQMFGGCSMLSELGLPAKFGSFATNMFNMFNGCSSLITLNLPNGFGFAAASMLAMFEGCTLLTTINNMQIGFGASVNGANPGRDNMFLMFGNCINLVSIAFPDTFGSSVLNTGGMFFGCTLLSSVTFPDNFGFLVTNTSNMFQDCTMLNNLILPVGFGNAGISSITGMFSNTPLLHAMTINVADNTPPMNLPAALLPNIEAGGCTITPRSGADLDQLPWSEYIMDGYIAGSPLVLVMPASIATPPVLFFDPPLAVPLVFDPPLTVLANLSNSLSITFLAGVTYTVMSGGGFSLHHVEGDFKEITGGRYRLSLASVDCFRNLSALTTLSLPAGLGRFNTSLVSMFRNCPLLNSITIRPNFGKTATNMRSMFRDCTALTSVTLPAGCGSVATNLSNVFDTCTAITSINLPAGFGGVADSLEYTLSQCTLLASITLPDGFGGVATSLVGLFWLSGFTSITLPAGFGFAATDLSYIFQECYNLATITNMQDGFGAVADIIDYAFAQSNALTSITLPAGFGGVATSAEGVFVENTVLTSVTLTPGFCIAATDISYMFKGCAQLATIALPLNFGLVATDARQMFKDCTSFVTLTLPVGFGNAGIILIAGMFLNTTALTDLYINVVDNTPPMDLPTANLLNTFGTIHAPGGFSPIATPWSIYSQIGLPGYPYNVV